MDVPTPAKTLSLLKEIERGDRSAAARLLPHVYEELRSLAATFFRRQRPGHTLQPTALVHEAYLRLVDQDGAHWRDRAHFVSVAAKAMRQILIDHFRASGASKRGGGWKKVTLSGIDVATPPPEIDFLALEEALTRLAALDERQVTVVELRFFGGLSVDEVSEVLGLSKTTVEGEWRAARAWLGREIRRGELR